jgi:hypothetical protein
MQRSDLVSGLKNTIERGYSFELAIQSFVNAGYSKQDVEDSARSLGYTGGVISRLPEMSSSSQQIQQTQQSRKFQSFPQTQQTPVQQKLPQPQTQQQISQAIKSPPPINPPSQPAYTSQAPIQQTIQINMPDTGIRRERSWPARNWLPLALVIILTILLTGLGLSIFAKSQLIEWLKLVGINLG